MPPWLPIGKASSPGMEAIDKRREWAAAAACQIVNQCLGQDAPSTLSTPRSRRSSSPRCRMTAVELRNDMLTPSDN